LAKDNIMGTDPLFEAAQTARERAYAPYSGFMVGAAVETADGAIVTGCNVENASYGLALCAERVAITRAIAEGHRAIRALAVAGPRDTTTIPCGTCRQFMAEFDPEMPVTYSTPVGSVSTTLAKLLPEPFGPRNLGVEAKRA
jgi:cytidine deaminase